MGDKKISQLSTAAPLDGSELVPIVQNATTQKTTMEEIANYVAGGEDTQVIFNRLDLLSGSANFTYNYVIDSLQQGMNATATGAKSHAEGVNTQAVGDYSHAEGSGAEAIGDYSHAEGNTSQAIGEYSHAEGSGIATGPGSHAEGGGTQAIGINSHAEGYFTIASGGWSHAEGDATEAAGDYSHAEGFNVKAVGYASHAEGGATRAAGDASHAEGRFTTSSGNFSHAEGSNTQAVGDYSHAEGSGSIASGSHSHAEGQNTIASGSWSHAEGAVTEARGWWSHAEGSNTKAIGFASHAEGDGAWAIGNASHAEGSSAYAIHDYSHAEGVVTRAVGYASHAEGLQTVASGSYQHVQGKYNLSSSAEAAFIVGNGVDDSNRSNLIFAAGNNVQITGSLKVTSGITGSLFGTASWAVSASWVQNAFSASYAATSSRNSNYAYYIRKVSNVLALFQAGSTLINEIGNGSGDGVNDIAWSMGSSGVITGSMSTGPFIPNKLIVTMGSVLGSSTTPIIFDCATGEVTLDATKLYIRPIDATNGSIVSPSIDWNSEVEIKLFK